MSSDDFHLLDCYVAVRKALDEMCQVRDKDIYLERIHTALYKMEDILFQYTTDTKRRNS